MSLVVAEERGVPFSRVFPMARFKIGWNVKPLMPDDGVLVDVIPKIAVTDDLRRKLLVDNPMRLYWGD